MDISSLNTFVFGSKFFIYKPGLFIVTKTWPVAAAGKNYHSLSQAYKAAKQFGRFTKLMPCLWKRRRNCRSLEKAIAIVIYPPFIFCYVNKFVSKNSPITLLL